MSYVILLIPGFYFFFLAHSTLLYFLAAEHKTLSLRQVLLPWPGRGRFVSVFAFLAGVLWMGMLWRANMPMDWHGRNLWWILSGFVGIPLFCYLWCIIRSATKQDGRWHFSPKQDGEGVMRLALVLIVVVNVLFKCISVFGDHAPIFAS